MSDDQVTYEPEKTVSDVQDSFQGAEEEVDEFHFESHPVEGTSSPISDATPSMDEDNISFKGESVPKPLGSVLSLDTIALETSPTMESLDLGETKSFDQDYMHYDAEKEKLKEVTEEIDDEGKIDVILGGEEEGAGEPQSQMEELQKEMDGISLGEPENPPEVNTQTSNVVTLGPGDEHPLQVIAPVEDDRSKLSSYFAAAPSNGDSIFDTIAATPSNGDSIFDTIAAAPSSGDSIFNTIAAAPSNGDNIFDTIAEAVKKAPEENFPVAQPTPDIPSEPLLFEERDRSLSDTSVPSAVMDSTHQSEPVEIIHQRHRNASTSVETPIVSFEGEALKTDNVSDPSTVSQFFPDETANDKEGKEFFDHFTSEGIGESVEAQMTEMQPETVEDNVQVQHLELTQKDKRKPGVAFVLPHLSPGPSPNTSAYASPIHHGHVTPAPTPNSTPLHQANLNEENTPYSPQRFSSDMTGLPAFSHNIPEPEDVFTASLHMNEADRQRDAWIPSELTRQILVSMVTSSPGTFYPKPEQLTMPGLISNEPQGDPIQDLLKKCIGEHEAMKRQSMNADNVSQDEEGLRQLIRAECWRSAVDLSGRLLTLHGQGMGKINIETKVTPQTLQLWFVRTSLLMKLKQYSLADNENAAFGNFDNPDLFYEYYPDQYPGRKGSMVPFSFRIINAELPHFLGRSQESLDKLYYVHAIVKKIIGHLENGLSEDGSMLELTEENRKASRSLWEQREMHILFAIVNVLVGIKTYDTAVDVLEILVKKELEKNVKIAVYSGLGRLYMQMGDIEGARNYFNDIIGMIGEKDEMGKCRNKMNQGFLSLGQNDFEVAKNYFKDVAEIDPTNAVAVNNMAVCYLYMGKLKEALQILEELVHENPAKYLQEGILINLCTLYELESSRALYKKQALLELVSKYKGNGFNISCLKMGEVLAKK